MDHPNRKIVQIRGLASWVAVVLLVWCAAAKAQMDLSVPIFEFSIQADAQTAAGQGVVMKVKSPHSVPKPDSMSEVVVWWTSAQGKKVSIPMKPFAEGIFVNRVVLGSEPGRGRLSVIVIGRSGGGGIAKVIQQDYDIELPKMQLRLVGQWSTEDAAERPAEAAPMPRVSTPQAASWSMPEVTILVGLFNLVLIIPALFFVKTARRVLHITNRQARVLPREVKSANPAVLRILEGGGLIGLIGPKQTLETAPQPDETKESGDLDEVSTDELFEIVEGAVKRLEGKKEKNTAAEPEPVAVIEKPSAPRVKASAPQKAEKQEKPAEKPEIKGITTIDGTGYGKIDLNDLSF